MTYFIKFYPRNDEMSGSTTLAVIHPQFNMRQFPELEIHTEKLAPEISRKKKFKAKKKKALVHGQNKTSALATK